MSLLAPLRRHWTTLTWWSVVVVAIVALVASAVFADGFPVRHVDLNDGGIWVTSDKEGLFGRLNKPAGALDAAFYPPGVAQVSYQLDVVQDGAAVAAWDQATSKLLPVDVNHAVTLSTAGASVGAGEQIGLAGGTIALLDPLSGSIWAQRVDTTLGITGLSGLGAPTRPLAALGHSSTPAAALAVGQDGTVYAVSMSGRYATIRPDGKGGFAPPVYAQLGHSFTSVQATVVGDRPVFFDASSGALVTPGGPIRSLGTNDPHAVLQAPGPDASSVLLATSKVLLSVDLSTGTATTMWSGGNGRPAAPVRLGDCVHAAWAGTANGYVRSCAGAPARPGNLSDASALVLPEFRVNRDAIVLNDLATGAVWDLATDRRTDDWDAVRPPTAPKAGKNNNSTGAAGDPRNLPPKANDDQLGARPGRTTLLHVLDNDSDPAGQILSIRSVTQPDDGTAHTSISPDGQTIALTVAATGSDLHFSYVIDDGFGHTSTPASVSVQIRTPPANRVPNVRPGAKQPAYAVPAGGHLSLPVLTDWRDFDGDPVVLVGADTKSAGATATATADGYVNLTAPSKGGVITVGYQVSDGVGVPVAGSVTVTVESPQSTVALPATAEPDVARGEVGHPIVVHPLDNDLPGADPTDPAAQVQLAAPVANQSGVTVATDLHSGTVTVTATRPGTYTLGYSAAFGNASFAASHIRVDVIPVPTAPTKPLAMPDTAILHGQVPSTVDVLDNDFDPAGNVLVVGQAAPVSASAQVSVAIIAGHWLRITALAPIISPNPQIVRYTISDGVTGPVTGEVSVTQIVDNAENKPVPVDDYATVRAGDAVTVPVLDNDSDTTGAPLSLMSNVQGAPAPGQLAVTGANGATGSVGTAYVDGNFVRYLPPASVPAASQMTISYLVADPDNNRGTGYLHVTVEPAPSKADPNRAPQPHDVTQRVVAGDSLIIAVPTTGIDPDGDSVAITGIGSGPKLGRIRGMNATSLTYEAYPSSAGTDSFSYLVTDRFGGVAKATIRIGVVPPGDPQPPVAVDDVVTAAPGAKVAVDVLANDLFAPDDAVSVSPLAALNPHLPGGVKLAAGAVDVAAPSGLRPEVISYAVTDGIGQPSIATVTVHGQKGYDMPPVTKDAYAVRTGTALTATVNIAGSSTDPDGTNDSLVFDPMPGTGAHISAGGVLTAPVSPSPSEVAYEVKDPGGAIALGIVHVPGSGTGGPYATSTSTIQVPRNGKKVIALADYVSDPAHKTIRLTTTDQIVASPQAGLRVAASGVASLVITGYAGYVGPGAITFQVTDGSSLTDPHGQTAVITLPVQVGPETPVMRCPNDPIDVVEGGATVTVEVTSVCHVWTAESAARAGLTYTATWTKQASAVTLGGAGTHALSFTASGSAVPGAVGTLSIGVAGSVAVHATMTIRVLAAAPPSVRAITVDGVKAPQSATIDLTSYVRSQLRDPQVSVVSITQISGQPAATVKSGATVRISPPDRSHGTMTFQVVVTDVAGPPRLDRRAVGQITLHVLSRPDAPGTPVPGRTVLSESVLLSWTTPANNGAPITSYTVTREGGQQSCPASPCLITGLTNGTLYHFRVAATNAVAQSDFSGASTGAIPNTVPLAVAGLLVSQPQDGSVRLTWTQPIGKNTPVEHYDISWTGGGRKTVDGGTLADIPNGLDNDVVYTFSVTGVNSLGASPTTSVTGQSAGAPRAPAAPSVNPANSADHTTRTVNVSWPADDPNGPGPTTYELQRSTGGSTVVICTGVTATNCADDGVGNDGTVYVYRVVAANADVSLDKTAHTSPPGPGTSMTAATTPEPIQNVSADGTGTDGAATLHFDAPRSNGASSTVTCHHDGALCGSWVFPTGGAGGQSEPITGLTNGADSTLVLQDCNGSTGAGADDPCDAQVSTDVVAYGPLKSLSVNASASGTTVNYSVSVDPNGKSAQVTIQTSKGTQTFTTGVGAWSYNGSDDMGYSATDTVNVTVADSGRTTLTQSASARTQDPPPPPPSISATEGVQGVGTIGSCTSMSQDCHWLDFQVHNFPPGNYTWRCITDGSVSYSSSAHVRITDPNQTIHGTDASGECIWGSPYSEAIEIDGYTSNAVPHTP